MSQSRQQFSTCIWEEKNALKKKFNLLFCCLFLLIFSLPLLASEKIDVLLEPIESVMLSPASSGHISKIMIREGDSVEKGMILFKINSQEEELEIKRLERVIKKRRYDYTSLSKLLKEDMTSRDEAMQAKMHLDLAEIELEKAKLALNRKSVRSPLNGRAVKVEVKKGQWVKQGQDAVLTVDYSRLYGTVLVNEKQAGYLKSLKESVLQIDHGSVRKKVAAKTVFVNPGYDPVTGLKLVKLEIDNNDLTIEPGMSAFLVFEKMIGNKKEKPDAEQ